MKKTKFLLGYGLAAISVTTGQAAVVSWDGGTGNWGDGNWTVDGTGAQVIGDTLDDDTVTINSGTVTQANAAVLTNNTTLTITGGSTLTTNFGTFPGLQIEDGSLLNITNATLNANTIRFAGGGDFSGGLLGSGANVNVTTEIRFFRTNVTLDGGSLSTGFLRIGNSEATFNLNSGNITLTSNNGLRADSSGAKRYNITGAAGALSITQANSVLGSSGSLGVKVAQEFFDIDGVNMDISADGSDLAVLNAELLADAILNGDSRTIRVDQTGSSQTLSIVAVPEPSSTALLGLGALSLILRRRK